nr:beta-CASP ribonuclease aCPSF1 [Methanothermus fervidus]
MTSEILKEIRKVIASKIPENVEITKVEFEGPELVVYTKNPEIVAEDGGLIRTLAKELKKRIIVRSDASALLDPEKTIEKIKEIVPEEAKITNIYFDDVTGEVIVEARKPGLVIGKHGSTSKSIIKHTGWVPKILRTPPIPSKIVEKIRKLLRRESKKRRQILRNLGCRIHRQPKYENDWARITALGGFREVGRSCLYLQTPNSKILLDCGVNVAANDEKNAYPYLNIPEFILDEIEAVVISHAHLDHSGFVPYLYHYGYRGPVYCSAPTRDLMALLQLDHIDIAEREGRELPFNAKDVNKCLKHTITLEYGEVTDITPDIRLTLHNAGHILGSAILHLHIGDGQHNLVYTGDFKYEKTRLLEPAVTDFPRLETLVMESTYGGKEDIQPSREMAEKRLIKVIYDTIKRGGKVLIPVFAVGRAQELMVVLDEYIKSGILEEIPIFVDGMVWEATAIHTTRPEYLSKTLSDQIFHYGYNPFTSEIFNKVSSSDERKDVVEGEPCVILSTSGMLAGGNSVEYFKWLCEDEKNTLVFVGYQAEGSLGRRLQKNRRDITFEENGKMKVYKVKMQIETIEGFSGHSDRKQLMKYVHNLSPKPEKILVCHGNAYKSLDLASSIYKKYRIETRAPLNLEAVRIY